MATWRRRPWIGLLVCALGLGLARLAEAATLNVPSQYPTLQAAFDAAQAGDEIVIASRPTPYQIGTVRRNTPYPVGQITVRGSGADPTLTVLEGSLDFHPLGSGNVTLVVSGLTIRKGSTATTVGLGASHERSLRSNQTAYSTTLVVTNCIVESYSIGVRADWGAHLTVSHSVVRNNQRGISVGHPPTTDTLPSIVYSVVAISRSVIANNSAYGIIGLGGVSPGF